MFTSLSKLVVVVVVTLLLGHAFSSELNAAIHYIDVKFTQEMRGYAGLQ